MSGAATLRSWASRSWVAKSSWIYRGPSAIQLRAAPITAMRLHPGNTVTGKETYRVGIGMSYAMPAKPFDQGAHAQDHRLFHHGVR